MTLQHKNGRSGRRFRTVAGRPTDADAPPAGRRRRTSHLRPASLPLSDLHLRTINPHPLSATACKRPGGREKHVGPRTRLRGGRRAGQQRARPRCQAAANAAQSASGGRQRRRRLRPTHSSTCRRRSRAASPQLQHTGGSCRRQPPPAGQGPCHRVCGAGGAVCGCSRGAGAAAARPGDGHRGCSDRPRCSKQQHQRQRPADGGGQQRRRWQAAGGDLSPCCGGQHRSKPACSRALASC